MNMCESFAEKEDSGK